MADETAIINAVADAYKETHQGYKNAIKAHLATVWSIVGLSYDWWFLRRPKPWELTLVADTIDYKIERTDVGLIRSIGNEFGKPVLKWLSDTDWQRMLADPGLINDMGGAYTMAGKDGNNPVIRVYPQPTTTTTLYVHYSFEPTMSHLASCPEQLVKALIHGVKSLVAPPKIFEKPNRDPLTWQTLTAIENRLFREELAEASLLLKAAKTPSRLVQGDPRLMQMLEEV